MKKLTLVPVVLAFFLMTGIANAQNIAISDVSHTADASAVLDVYSTSLGMLVPRLSSAPSTPANGLFYYNTGSNSFYYNAGTSGAPSWTELSYGNLWSTNGTDTYLTDTADNALIGTAANPLGYKFYVNQSGPGLPMTNSRIDGQVEFWNYTGGGNLMLADINDNGGAVANGIMQLYFGGIAGIRLLANGSSFFKGGNVGIGANPATLLHVVDNFDLSLPQFQIDNPTGLGGGSTSIGFNYVDVTGASHDFSEGIFGADATFKVCNNDTLTNSVQGDGKTMFRAFPSGIIDMNNQSRARVYQDQNPTIEPPNLNYGQIIPNATWTMVNFDKMSYDQQNEWNLAANAANGPSYFVVTEDGYYQVNSRIDFVLDNFEEQDPELAPIHNPNYPGYVSIAIYVSQDQGQTWQMYAQGNKLQGADNGTFGDWNDLRNNLAPNVSDVVEVHAGDWISIYAWQSLASGFSGTGIPLRTMEQNTQGGPRTQVYCSIHKSS